MPYIDWFAIEEVYAGTHLRDNTKAENGSLALHTTENKNAIILNRKAFMQELKHPLDNCVFANQTHSCNIHKVTKEDIGKGSYSIEDAIENCDALYTREKNILIGVFTADCVPILLYDKAQGIIAAVHSGWKGTAQMITKKMIDVLKYDEDSEMEDIYAYIGPSIDFFSYEVGDDVISALKETGMDITNFIIPKENGKYLFDNKRMNMQMLLDAGVPDTNIFMSDKDSYENEEDFFSYRKNKDSGRNLTFILRK